MILRVDGIDARVERLGEGRQLLLLHGWGPASVSLEKHLLPLGQSLRKNYEVTMLEFPGHGQTGLPEGDWGVKEYALWTLKAMDLLGLSRPVIVAHSFGGRIALWLAANQPHRVDALVLTGAAGLRPQKTLTGFVRGKIFRLGRLGLDALGLVPAFRGKRSRWLQALRGQFASADYLATPESLRGSFSRVVSEDLRPLLPKISQKTLLVWGEKDTAAPLWMGQAMAAEITDARLLVYGADDHFAYVNQLARFVTAVDAFLEEVAPQ